MLQFDGRHLHVLPVPHCVSPVFTSFVAIHTEAMAPLEFLLLLTSSVNM